MIRGYVSLLVICLLIAPGMALSDTTLVFERTSGDSTRQQPPMQISNGMIRFAPDGPETGQYMLFDAKRDVLTIVDEKQGIYTPLSSDSFDQISAMQKQMMDSLEAQLAQLPEEQRAEAKRMMEGMGQSMPGTESKVSVETRRTARMMEVKGMSCTVLEVHRGNEKISDTCVTTRSELNIPADDYRTLMDMQDFLMSVSSRFFDMGESSYFYGDASRQEFPILITEFEDGGERVTRFQSVGFANIDPKLFRIDPSLEEKDIMSGMNR